MDDEKNTLDDQQIEAMLAPLRKPSGRKPSRLRPLVIGLSLMAAMLVALVFSLPKSNKNKAQTRGGPVATCGNDKVEPGEDCEPPNAANCGPDCLRPATSPQEQQPAQRP